MRLIDGHSHMYQTLASSKKLKKSVDEIEGFDANLLIKRLGEIEVSKIQTMPQEMTRIRGQWLGSNKLSAEIQQHAPSRIVSFAAAEPLDVQDNFNIARLEEVEKAIVEKGLKGLLLLHPTATTIQMINEYIRSMRRRSNLTYRSTSITLTCSALRITVL